MSKIKYLGIDVGAETVKLAVFEKNKNSIKWTSSTTLFHQGDVEKTLREKLGEKPGFAAVGVTGRGAARLRLLQVPLPRALEAGVRFLHPELARFTVLDAGAHGYCSLEVHDENTRIFRENTRCSQGTGNFLAQLTGRFGLSVEAADETALPAQALPLSGRCPVILKTDMTHLANKGEDRIRILAGLFDAVCDNVLLLVKPGISPARVVLVGGVGRCPRVRRTLAEALRQRGMELLELGEPECQCLEAIGCAVAAAESPSSVPAVESLIVPAAKISLERLPGLGGSLSRVKRMAAPPLVGAGKDGCRLVVGLDIGSTGSKLVGLDIASREVLWEGYRRTLGDPVGAAQDLLRQFLDGPVGRCPIVAFGATGSGREVVGSLLLSCFGRDAVFIVNEIVAHAAGALHYDPRVDTIFEIGGQDAKYIRLADGRVTDCAMNEACSAGTGSFIEEQGGKFAGIRDVAELGREALAAPAGVSLGQHCSVFMAEVIDEAVASGAPPSAILSGLYDSIIQNYLNRVKANRSIGKVIFCQGMPFAADALAAAVARQTGCQVIVPPNPGTVGALGIALLAVRELQAERLAPLRAAFADQPAKAESHDPAPELGRGVVALRLWRLIGDEQLEHHLAALACPLACRFHLHAGGRLADAGSGEHALALDLDHAGAAIAVGAVGGLRQPAQVRDRDAQPLRHLPDRLPGGGLDLAAVDFQAQFDCALSHCPSASVVL